MWTKPIRAALRWLDAFLHMEGAGPIRRVFALSTHLNLGDPVRITTDASPWGVGAFIVIQGEPHAYFYDAISDEYHRIMKVKAGSADGQQCWECLAVLASLRLWRHLWRSDRVRLHVRADNVTTLTMLRHLRVKGAGLAGYPRIWPLSSRPPPTSPTCWNTHLASITVWQIC